MRATASMSPGLRLSMRVWNSARGNEKWVYDNTSVANGNSVVCQRLPL